MNPDLPTAHDLMPLMQFSADDLAANQQGRLGEGQVQRLHALQKRILLIGITGFFSFALIATILLYLAASAFILTLLGILTTLINALFIGIFARQWLQIRRDIQTGRVETLSGQLERVVKADNRMNNFILRIAGEDFYVKKELFRLFRHETAYNFYRSPAAKVLLAAEPSED